MTKKKPAAQAIETIQTFKGFNQDLTCRDYQFEIGKTFTHEGDVKACEGGFHACEYPLDVFRYYPPANSRYCQVEQSGDLSRHDDDSKVASRSISLKVEIDIPFMIKAAIEWTMSRCKPIDPESPALSTGARGAASSTGYQGAASSTGYQGAASSTGARGAASSTGYQGAASSTGYQGAASSTGDCGAASSTGYQGAASSTGYQGAASSTGARGAASSTGYQGAASSTGDCGAASSTGDCGAASSTGARGAASSTGARGAASSTGDCGAASNEGQHGIAAAFGYESKAKSSETGAIVCVYRNDDGDLIHIRASKVGENDIKPDTWYMLDADGNFIEVET